MVVEMFRVSPLLLPSYFIVIALCDLHAVLTTGSAGLAAVLLSSLSGIIIFLQLSDFLTEYKFHGVELATFLVAALSLIRRLLSMSSSFLSCYYDDYNYFFLEATVSVVLWFEQVVIPSLFQSSSVSFLFLFFKILPPVF